MLVQYNYKKGFYTHLCHIASNKTICVPSTSRSSFGSNCPLPPPANDALSASYTLHGMKIYSAGGYPVQQLLQSHEYTDTRPPRYGLRDTGRSVCNLYSSVANTRGGRALLLTLRCPLSSLSHSFLSFCDFTKADL